jgi:tetratricopeptide (TPR) repeat protein
LHVAADALQQIWPPEHHRERDLAAVLRSNTDALTTCDHHHALWRPDAHRLLFTAGLSLLHLGLHQQALAYWEPMTTTSQQILGEEHPDTIMARANLASSYWSAGRTGEAIAIEERVLADSERLLGEEHPDTIRARANLAVSYQQAGRTGEAMAIQERVLADRERLLGEEHPDTLIARANLATIRDGSAK